MVASQLTSGHVRSFANVLATFQIFRTQINDSLYETVPSKSEVSKYFFEFLFYAGSLVETEVCTLFMTLLTTATTYASPCDDEWDHGNQFSVIRCVDCIRYLSFNPGTSIITTLRALGKGELS